MVRFRPLTGLRVAVGPVRSLVHGTKHAWQPHDSMEYCGTGAAGFRWTLHKSNLAGTQILLCKPAQLPLGKTQGSPVWRQLTSSNPLIMMLLGEIQAHFNYSHSHIALRQAIFALM